MVIFPLLKWQKQENQTIFLINEVGCPFYNLAWWIRFYRSGSAAVFPVMWKSSSGSYCLVWTSCPAATSLDLCHWTLHCPSGYSSLGNFGSRLVTASAISTQTSVEGILLSYLYLFTPGMDLGLSLISHCTVYWSTLNTSDKDIPKTG